MGESVNGSRVFVSIIVPVLDEEATVLPLAEEIFRVMSVWEGGYEVIFVDDGSVDDSASRLSGLASRDGRVTLIRLTKTFGQTAALSAGIDQARGEILVPMDADGQNDPGDIPRLLAKLDEGGGRWDIVSGWRRSRQDRLLSRSIPSRLANLLVRRMTWTPEIHDFGCSLKAYRRRVIDDVRLYGEMHRFLPAICKIRGARVTELEVNHRPRTAGESKYGLKRTGKVLLDLCTVKFFGDYVTKPIYFFGKMATVLLGLAVLALGVSVVQKFGWLTEHGGPVMLNDNVLVLFSMMSVLMAGMSIMMGILSEILVRIYHEARGLRPYKVWERVGPGGGGERQGAKGGRSSPRGVTDSNCPIQPRRHEITKSG